MKKVRIGALVGLFAVVCVVVGVLVWPTPKEAMAVQRYQVQTRDQGDNWVVGLNIEIQFRTNVVWEVDWYEMTDEQNGDYYYDRANGIAQEWRTRINDIGWSFVDPSVNPCSHAGLVTSFTWELVEVR